jgi:threonine/homoserine/homoserine lactone efflux protein
VTFSLAFALGFSVASIPGPTIILTATETLRKGATAGLLTMLAPLFIDAAVMLPLGLFLQISISRLGAFALAIVGAAFLSWMGLQSLALGFRKGGMGIGELISSASRQKREVPSFVKGIVTHLTSPFPYLYWGTVGSTFVREGLERNGAWGGALFPLGFWTGTTTFTLLVIYLLARSKRFVPPHLEPYLHQLSGALLILSGIFLLIKVWRGFL